MNNSKNIKFFSILLSGVVSLTVLSLEPSFSMMNQEEDLPKSMAFTAFTGAQKLHNAMDNAPREMEASEIDTSVIHAWANMYYFGNKCIEQDLEKARELYTRGAKFQGFQSMVSLAMMYLLGEGGEKDVTKAMELLDNASISVDNTASLIKGEIYQYGLFGENKDSKLAEELFNKAVSDNMRSIAYSGRAINDNLANKLLDKLLEEKKIQKKSKN